MSDMAQKHDLTLYFAECPHSERIAEDIMADFYPAFVFLLLPLCHLLRYRRGSVGAVVGLLLVCLWGSRRGAGHFTSLTASRASEHRGSAKRALSASR